MKFSTVILSSFLAFTAAVKGAAIDEQTKNIIIKQLNLDSELTIEPLKQCPLALNNIIIQFLKCNNMGGKFYQKLHKYPSCSFDYVCFVPPSEDVNLNTSDNHCISIEGKNYCSADVSNINVCKKLANVYNFEKCVEQASEFFAEFEYGLPVVHTPPPPPTPPKTKQPKQPHEPPKHHQPKQPKQPKQVTEPVPSSNPVTIKSTLILPTRTIAEPIETPVETPIETPVVETTPVVEEPVVQEPVIEEPIVEEPTVNEPVVEEPAVEEPIVNEPAVEEPVVEEPVVNEPAVEEPTVNEPAVEEPVVEEPVVNEPVVEEPVVEEPVVNEPVVEEPVVNEPVVEEPVVNEPAVEEPQNIDLKGDIPPTHSGMAGGRIRMDVLGNVTIDGEFYLQTLTNSNLYTPGIYLGNGGDFPGFYEGDTSVKFYTAREDNDIVIVVFENGSQLNLIKTDLTYI